MVFYYKKKYSTTKHNILPQSVVFPMNYSTVKCSIAQQNIVVYFPMNYSTSIDIIPQSVAFLRQSVVFSMNYFTTNCSISLKI